MNDDNDAVSMSAFNTGQGFPTAGEEHGVDSEYPYPYKVMEPEPVTHLFPKPEEPTPPTNRAELEASVPQYVKYVLHEYDLAIEWSRLAVSVDGRFTNALGKCGAIGYHEPRVRISAKHYDEWNYSWHRCKETIRHELAHAWQVRWLGYTSHGPTFRQKARELDCTDLARYDGKGEPKYVAHCQNCGNSYSRYRACRRTRDPYNGCSACDTFGHGSDAVEGSSIWVVFDNTDWHKVMDYE